MARAGPSGPERVRAVEGSNCAGRPPAQRLLADDEHVVDVPAKLSALARLLDTGHNRKTDAHAVAVVAVRTTGLRVLSYVDELEALRMLADRREELTRQRVQTINRLQRLLSELLPGTDPVTALEQTAFGHDDLGRAGGDWRYYPLCPMARTTQRSAIGVVTLRSL